MGFLPFVLVNPQFTGGLWDGFTQRLMVKYLTFRDSPPAGGQEAVCGLYTQSLIL